MEDRSFKKYTKQERDYICDQVDIHIDNLSKCFIALSKELGRTPDAIRYQWYRELNNPESKHYRGTTSVLLTKKAILVNRKIENPTFKIAKSRVKIWKSVLSALSNIINKIYGK